MLQPVAPDDADVAIAAVKPARSNERGLTGLPRLKKKNLPE
jgi:hypothetical protein